MICYGRLRKPAVHPGVLVKVVQFVQISVAFPTMMLYLVDMITWLLKWEWSLLVQNSTQSPIGEMVRRQSDVYVKKNDVTVIVLFKTVFVTSETL